MLARNFPVLGLALIVSSVAIGCGNSSTPAGPDPALAGTSPPPGGAQQSPPPNTSSAPKTASVGTLQDLCASSIVKDAFGGVVKSFVRFTKDIPDPNDPSKMIKKTIVVDPCLGDGAAPVSFEKFVIRGREDLLVPSNDCLSGGNCWYRILDVSKAPAGSKLKYATLDQLRLAGRYKDGENTSPIPGDANFTIGAWVDDKGQPTTQTVKYITQYKAPPASDGGPFLTVKRYEEDQAKLDKRLAVIETNTTTLMASYSDWLRAKEAM
jgi:hypothetical protein